MLDTNTPSVAIRDLDLHFGDVKTGLGRRPGRLPIRRLKPHQQLVAPARRMPCGGAQTGIHLYIGPQRIPAIERDARAIDAAFLLFLEGAKQPVPHDQMPP